MKDRNEEEWQTYIGMKSKKMAKRPLPIIVSFEKLGVKIHGRKDSKKNKKKKKNTQKKSIFSITLVEYTQKKNIFNLRECQ